MVTAQEKNIFEQDLEHKVLLKIYEGVLILGRKIVTVGDRPFGKNTEAIPEELRSRCLADFGLTNGDQNLHGKIL